MARRLGLEPELSGSDVINAVSVLPAADRHLSPSEQPDSAHARNVLVARIISPRTTTARPHRRINWNHRLVGRVALRLCSPSHEVMVTITEGNMSSKNIAVFGIYPTHDSADAAVETLRTKGFRNTDVSVLFPQNSGSKEFGHEKGTKSAEGAVAGGGTGAVIGGALGWLAGIGMLAIPGVGPFIAAGPIVAALAGMGAGGAIGSTTGALIGLGNPEYQAKRYGGRMRKGGILLSVHADDQEWASKGKQILEQTGAEDISSTGETKGDFGNTDRPTARVETVTAPTEVVKH